MDRHHFKTAGCRIFIAAVLTFIALVCITSFSCQMNPEGITILGGTYECPKLIDFSIQGKHQLQMTFSQKVEITDIRITDTTASAEQFAGTSTMPAETEVTDNGDGTWQYNLTFTEEFTCGSSYVLYGVVEDSYGNTLSFSSGFAGYNDNLPVIVLNEVRTEYSKPKLEYIELYVLEDGNLGGMVMEAYYGTKSNTFIFPAADVHQGDYIVLHMRTVDETAVDETEDITACTAPDSCASARDFWYQSEVKALGKTGVILLKERENGALCDALLYAESSKSYWPQDIMKTAAQSAYLAGIWTGSAETSDAVCSDRCTTTRTLSRQNYSEKGASAWIVVATSCATPGAANSAKPAD